ncbi:MAG: heparinase II/III family protein [Lentisphaeria bacterium]|nr:heparinase II/III family protein [Lentisphaeria bacterium]
MGFLSGSWRAASPALAMAASAAAYSVQHPVFPAAGESAERLAADRAASALVLSFERAEIDRWIVAKSSFEMVACPHCEWPGGRRDRKNYWRWSPQDPDRIRCLYCNTVYPDERYPLSAVQHTIDPTGQTQEFPYFPGRDGYRYYLAGKIENARKQYMEEMVPRLARLYGATGEGGYARQAARILDRLAEAYAHYNPQVCRREGSPLLLELPVLNAPDGGLVPVPPFGRGTPGRDDGAYYPYWSNRRGDGWNGWLYSEMPTALVYAYDAIADSPELDRLGRELERDVRDGIRRYFLDTANYVRSYPPYAGNMDPSIIQGFAVIGRVIGEPELVHDALRRVQLILDRRFYPDGNWKEGAPSYHAQTISGLQRAVAGPLKGYSDPPGYHGREDGRHLEDVDLSRELPLLGESALALAALTLPNGSQACIHDTWSPTTHGRALRPAPPAPMSSHLHWGMGHAVLGCGRQDTGTQTHLHFSGGYGHQHADTLNLVLFGKGRELLSDIGYTHTVMAAYSRHSLAHNLVVVDEQDQRTGGVDPPADGYLVVCARLGAEVQYVEAGGEGAYPGRVRVYRRAVALVAAPNGEAYALDLFRVAGGSRHDWVLHGSADADMSLDTSLPLEPCGADLLREGVTFRLWKNEYGRNMEDGVNLSYGLFRDPRRAGGEEDLSLRWEEAGGTGVRVTLLGQAGATVFCGRLPSVRRAREDSSNVMDHWMPAVLVRRDAKEVQSLFAAVHQACGPGTPRFEAGRLAAQSTDPLAVGVVVRGPGFADYHLSGAAPTTVLTLSQPRIRAVGRYVFVRIQDGRVAATGLADGSALEVEGQALSILPSGDGPVLATRDRGAGDPEDALLTSARLPARNAMPGERVVVRFADGMTYGLAVREIRGAPEGSAIVLHHRPGFTVNTDGSTRMTHHPGRAWAERPVFHLPGGG